MISGRFKDGEPVIELVIKGRKLEFLLDTGFNGQLMVSRSLIRELHLEQIGFSDYTTASGEKRYTDVHICELDFLGTKIECIVLSTEADFQLIGMELLGECKMVIDRSKNMLEISRSI